MNLMLKQIILTGGLFATTALAQSAVTIPPPVEAPPVYRQKSWYCPGCSPNEQYVLRELQEHTKIRDKNALATILGNIKQESNFRANVCEGGARVPYPDCHRGGYGIIQWTTVGRYNGLGNFCKKYGCDPSSLEGQTRYMLNENQFRQALSTFEGGGQSISYYMNAAYWWLGWGIKGRRQSYAFDYLNKLVYS